MDVEGFVEKWRYLLLAGVIIFFFTIFLLCLLFFLVKRKTEPKYEKLPVVEEQKTVNENSLESRKLADINEEAEEADVSSTYTNDTSQDGCSLTSDDDILNPTDEKKTKKEKRRYSAFTFTKPTLKSKHVKKNSMIDLSKSFDDINTFTTTSHPPDSFTTPLHPPSRSRSMESIISVLSYGMESLGDNLLTCRLKIYAKYDPQTWVLNFGCRQAECVLNTIEKTSYWKVHMSLLPFKNERFKTQTKPSVTPVFNETFTVDNIAEPVLHQVSVRYRLYGRTTESGPKKMAGEVHVNLGPLLYERNYEISEWRTLIVTNDKLKKSTKEKVFGVPKF